MAWSLSNLPQKDEEVTTLHVPAMLDYVLNDKEVSVICNSGLISVEPQQPGSGINLAAKHIPLVARARSERAGTFLLSRCRHVRQTGRIH